jgi:hypothetical protein
MGNTSKEEGRTHAKARKRRAQCRPPTRNAPEAVTPHRHKGLERKRRKCTNDLVVLALRPTPRVRGRSSYLPEAACRERQSAAIALPPGSHY